MIVSSLGMCYISSEMRKLKFGRKPCLEFRILDLCVKLNGSIRDLESLRRLTDFNESTLSELICDGYMSGLAMDSVTITEEGRWYHLELGNIIYENWEHSPVAVS